MEASKHGSVSLSVAATLLDTKGTDEKIESVAYVFSAGGQLLGHKPLDAKGNATLTIPATAAAQSVRVLVGPQVDQDAHTEGLAAELARRGAQEAKVRLDAGATKASAVLQIPSSVWQCWLRSACVVRGTLLKHTDRDGVSMDLPVVNATVEVYEVDPITIILPRIPDDILAKIRELILIPLPWPPDPIGPISVLPGELDAQRRAALAHVPALDTPVLGSKATVISQGARTASVTTTARTLSRTAAVTSAARSDVAIPATSASLHALELATTPREIRATLLVNPSLVRPILCRFFPQYVTMHRIATATTNDCGHFQALFFRGCGNTDQPDLYFKARQRIFGFFDVVIYAPTPIVCHTYWNYQCGTEVTLHTTHPLAITGTPCQPVVAPNNWVLFTAVGNFPVSRIRGASSALAGTTTPSTIGLTDGNAPFGGTLRFRLDFDNSLRDSLNVKYYQVSYRKGTSGAFTPLIGECHRHYTHEVGSDLVLEVFTLGPKVVNNVANLFEIPPGVPPLGQWTYPDAVQDLTNAVFTTTDVAPLAAPGVAWPGFGSYEIKVDLFDANANPVNITAKGIKYVVPTSTDLSGTISTVDASTLGLVSGNSFILTLQIDNSVCSASIDAPTINGTPADDCCGVLHYNPADAVKMPWSAVQAHQFATYSFGVVRGVQPVVSQSGTVAPVPFSTTQTVATLMSANPAPGCNAGGCTVAGFSENLYVAAMATDGWGRLSGYDASAVRAFVLAQ